jgi:hypothetical protein
MKREITIDLAGRDAVADPITVPNTLWQAVDPTAYGGGQQSDITHLAEFEASGLGRPKAGGVVPAWRPTQRAGRLLRIHSGAVAIPPKEAVGLDRLVRPLTRYPAPRDGDDIPQDLHPASLANPPGWYVR